MKHALTASASLLAMYSIYYKRSYNSVQLISPTSTSIMLVILIPFFLIGRISIEEDVWSPNLEYNFKFNVSISGQINSESDTYLYSTVKANLLCRPKRSDILTCIVNDPLIRNVETEIANASESYLEHIGKWFDFDMHANPRFEIHFDRNGAKSLVVSRSAVSSNLNIYRTIANQLSIGANLEHRMSGDFSAMENSTIGQCEVFYKIHKNGQFLHREQTDGATFTLISVANNHKPRGKIIEIEKYRNLNNCRKRANYFFGASETHTVYEQKLEPRVKSYFSKFYISDTVFRSESHANTQLVVDEKIVGTVDERMILTLESIQEVNSDIPEVEDAQTIGIIGEDFTKKLRDNIEIHETSTESEETKDHSKTSDNE